MTRVLIVEDDRSQREMLREALEEEGFEVEEAASGEDALRRLWEVSPDIVLLDYRLPGLNGGEVLKRIRAENPLIQVVMITAYGSVEQAVEAMRSGAFHYITKPVNFDELFLVLRRAQERIHLIRENQVLKERLEGRAGFKGIVYVSRAMEEVMSLVARVAVSNATVLVTGESGTGKELIAAAIHYASPRAEGPFIRVNLAALPETLLESELFGHERGAFTGADRRRIGRFEAAKGGTLFLDEIGDLPLQTQVKLLRVLQERVIERLGSNEPIPVDVRVIAATHQDIENLVREGRFREDLYYRLNVVRIHIPPLRERKEDIPVLVDAFLRRFSEREGKRIRGLTKEALDALVAYDYPGNVRELENIIERAVVLARGEYITLEDLPFTLRPNGVVREREHRLTLNDHLEALEKSLILDALIKHQWVQTRAAEELGISERVLRYKMAKYGLSRPSNPGRSGTKGATE